MTILFTCAGRRNYLLRYFKQLVGDNGTTIAIDSDTTAPALMESDIALTVPSLFDNEYMPTLLGIVRDYEVDMVIPLNDLELPIMAAHRAELESFGAKVIISSPEIIELCADKWKTYTFFKKIGVFTPETFLGIEATIAALEQKRIDFPVILKPRWGFGSVGVHEVKTMAALRLAHALLLTQIGDTLMASIAGDTLTGPIIFQEKIGGEEYGIDIINDFHGKHYASYARKKLAMRAGETDKAKSVIDARFAQMAAKIAENTKHIGIMDCDFFLKNDIIYYLEMNPRFGGGYPFSHQAGLNLPGMYMRWHQGNQDVSNYDHYRAECIFSKCERILEVKQPEKADPLKGRAVF